MSNDWIYIGIYQHYTHYYRESSITIDEQKNIINVLVKCVMEKKRFSYFKNIYTTKGLDYIQFSQQNRWYAFNYKTRQFTITRITDYSQSGYVLLDTIYQPKWLHNFFPAKLDDIISGSIAELCLDKLIQDYNIWDDFQIDTGINTNYNVPDKPSKATPSLKLLMDFITRSLNFIFINF